MTLLEILAFLGLALACVCLSVSSAVALVKDRAREVGD